MKEIFRIRHTVKKLGSQLEQLAQNNVNLNRAFDILAKKSQSIEEMVIIEVMREVYDEYVEQRSVSEIYADADSNTRSARMPAMALSR